MLQISWKDRQYHRKPIPKPPETRRARHARRVKQREEWRTALGLWAIGAHITQERALLDVGLREAFRGLTAAEKLRQLSVGGPVVRAIRQMGAACGTDLPVGGKLQTRVSDALTNGLKLREKRAKAARDLASLNAEESPNGVYVFEAGSIQSSGLIALRRRQGKKFGMRVIEAALKAFTSPRGAPPKWVQVHVSGKQQVASRTEFRRSNRKHGQQATLIIGVTFTALKFWRHGLHGFFGPKSLIVDAKDDCVLVLKQKGPHTYIEEWEPAPALTGEIR